MGDLAAGPLDFFSKTLLELGSFALNRCANPVECRNNDWAKNPIPLARRDEQVTVLAHANERMVVDVAASARQAAVAEEAVSGGPLSPPRVKY